MEKIRLIALYYHICDYYDRELRWHCQRFSNNSTTPDFTDEELLTIYLNVMIEEENRVAGRYKIKSIWRYAHKHLHAWFPELPRNQAFNARLNRLAEVFPLLCKYFLSKTELPTSATIKMIDALPIILCRDKRKAKVAPQLSDKGYCATKQTHY